MNTISHHSDLLKRIKEGDEPSFERLFHALYPRLCAYANKFLNDLDEAEEIVQQVFVTIWKNRALLDESLSSTGYLYTAVRNNCFTQLEHLRVQDKYANLLFNVYQSSPNHVNQDEQLIATELERDFQKALATLPEQCRTIFTLSRIDGLKYREIAVRLNISVKTVETQMSRALHKMRLQLKEYITLLILLHIFK